MCCRLPVGWGSSPFLVAQLEESRPLVGILCFLLPPAFYIVNMVHGSGIIFVPSLPPYGILNVRYTALFIPGLCLFLPGIVNTLVHVVRRVGRLGWLSGATGAKWGVGAILTVLFLSGTCR
jgi:hypothetical protein